MDSGNSGSIQSSSGGGDEECDSRTESISSFLNPSTHFASISNPNPILPPPPLSHSHHPPTTFFDPSPFSHSPPNPNGLYNNLDLVWSSRNLRSEPNFTDFGTVTQSLLGSQGLSQGSFPAPSTVDANVARVSTHSDHHQQITNVGGGVAKNSKKRTRASRRAPTTVLTTDTTNFRQMVQEFTGIPAAPFSGASPFSRRLDLFGGGSAMGVGPLYPLRPSAQKIQVPSPTTTSAMVDTTATNNITTATSTVGTSNNYQPPSDHGFPKQPRNLLNLQDPMFSFQSLLQTPFHPLGNATLLGTNSDQGNSSINVNPLDDQQVLNSNLSGFPSSSARWRDGGQDEHLGSFDGNNRNSRNVRAYKLNSSDFQPEKGLENVVSSRGDQGNMDSWICPSD